MPQSAVPQSAVPQSATPQCAPPQQCATPHCLEPIDGGIDVILTLSWALALELFAALRGGCDRQRDGFGNFVGEGFGVPRGVAPHFFF